MSNLLFALDTQDKSGINLKGIKFFKEISICHNINTKVREEIESILYMKADIFIGEISLIKTDKMISNEGVILSGYKLRVELIINEFFKYSSKFSNSSVGIIRNNIIKTVYITVPEKYKNVKIEELYRKKKISIKGYLEDMYCDKYKGQVDANLTILVNCNIS